MDGGSCIGSVLYVCGGGRRGGGALVLCTGGGPLVRYLKLLEGNGWWFLYCPRCRYLGFSHNAIGPPHLTAFVSF